MSGLDMPFKSRRIPLVWIALVTVLVVAAIVGGVRYFKNRGPLVQKSVDHEEHEHEDDSLESSTVTVESVDIEIYAKAPGIVDFHPKHALRIHPTFPGIVLKVSKSVGDSVSAGEVLASVESNVGIQTYSIISPIRGVVIARNVSEGQSVSPEEELFSVGDASVLQAKLFVAARDVKKIQSNQSVVLVAENQRTIRSTVRFVSPVLSEDTRTATAIVDFQSPHLRPGMFITGAVAIGKHLAEKSLPSSYCANNLKVRDIMLSENGKIERRSITFGQSDYEHCEVLSGLEVGDEVMLPIMVSTNEKDEEQDEDHDHDHE